MAGDGNGGLPAGVVRAVRAAERVGFALARGAGPGPSCCLPDAGRVLAVLAAARPARRLALPRARP
jgi:hypothetical protein